MKVKRTFFSLEEVSTTHQNYIKQAMAEKTSPKTPQATEDVLPKPNADVKSTRDVGVQISTLKSTKEQQLQDFSNPLKVCLFQ